MIVMLQARNFAVMTGVNAGVAAFMKRWRGKDDINNQLVCESESRPGGAASVMPRVLHLSCQGCCICHAGGAAHLSCQGCCSCHVAARRSLGGHFCACQPG